MLNTEKIMFYKNIGFIVIEPFNEAQLNTNSYDVRLGEWICRQNISEPIDGWQTHKVIKYNSKSGTKEMWQEPIKQNNSIRILPGETILAHTQEVIGGRETITTEMRAKSTTARYGLSVCKCAGLGDIGFISKWTMEMTNHSNFILDIPIGEPIAQILFHEVGQVKSDYGKLGGRYGQGNLWTPEDMLPKGKYE